VVFLEVPELSSVDAKKTLSSKIDAAIATAYAGLANTDETLILWNHYPLANSYAAGLQAAKPEVVEGISKLNA
jgi:hypothetical protein